MNSSPQYTEILNIHQQLHYLEYQHWLQYELFTYQWWLLLGLLILPWLVWWKLVDKSRIFIILSFGLLIMFAIIAMDAFGIVFHYWIYPIKLIPVIPHTIPIDWSMLPVYHMLIYQYFPRWRSFLVAELIGSALLAFVGESIAAKIGIYYVLNWQHTWSFVIYLLKSVAAKGFIDHLIPRKKEKE